MQHTMQLCVLLATKKIEGGVAVCVHPSRREARAGFLVYRSGSCSVMYTENLAIYVISVCDFNQRQSWPRSCRKITQHLLEEREREGEREWGELQEGGFNRLYERRLRAVAVAQARFKFPGPPPPSPKSVYGSSLIKEHHKSVARAIAIMNLISIRAFI